MVLYKNEEKMKWYNIILYKIIPRIAFGIMILITPFVMWGFIEMVFNL